uniref:Uncharacterized protein n=1 Tax=Anopheles albimanus TaxID=7167 RepID=A0A182FYM1_ANOAL
MLTPISKGLYFEILWDFFYWVRVIVHMLTFCLRCGNFHIAWKSPFINNIGVCKRLVALHIPMKISTSQAIFLACIESAIGVELKPVLTQKTQQHGNDDMTTEVI